MLEAAAAAAQQVIDYLISAEANTPRVLVMSKSVEVFSNYTFHKDFDYYRFIEDRSHSEFVVDRLEPSISELVVSASAIRDGQIQSAEVLSEEIRSLSRSFSDSIDRLDSTIQRVGEDVVRSIDDLRGSVEAGFQEVSFRLGSLQVTLKDLLKVAKTPEQTWAYEQFDIARDLCVRGFPDEALKHIVYALDGRGDRMGYQYDHRIHMLKGVIHLGSRGWEKGAYLNLNAAKASFELAVRYAGAVSSDKANGKGRIEALRYLAWTLYCQGNVQDSIGIYRMATDEFPSDAQSWYGLSKALLHAQMVEPGLAAFARCIEHDASFALDSGKDRDFTKYKDLVSKVIDRRRTDLASELADGVASISRYLDRPKYEIIERIREVRLTDDVSFLESIRTRLNAMPLSHIARDFSRCKKAISSISTKKDEAISELNRSLREVRSKVASDSAMDSKHYDMARAMMIGCSLSGITGVLVFIYFMIYGDEWNAFTFIFAFIFTGIGAGMVAAVSLVVTVPLGFLCELVLSDFEARQSTASSLSFHNSEKAKIEKDLAALL